MILVFTPNITNRIEYAVKLVLHDICGYDYKITRSADEFTNFKGGRINYSDCPFTAENIIVKPSGFLLENGIRDFQPFITKDEKLPKVFAHNPPTNGINCHLGYDIFSAAFYLITRYEEYLPFEPDGHGRFETNQSLAYRSGFLEKPIIDIYARQFSQKISEIFPHLVKHQKRYKFIPTYDIDIAYAYRGRWIGRNFLAFAKDMLSLDLPNMMQRTKVLLKITDDPFDTYSWQFALQAKYNLSPIYFFLAGKYDRYDKNISVESKWFKELVKTIDKYADAGIHPSMTSHFKKRRLNNEIKILSGILNRPVVKSRQHYLKLSLPETYNNLIKQGIENDFSMGYASHPGFRAGTCTPFYFYDLLADRETTLKVFPTAVMDGTLNDYLKLEPNEALKKIKTIIDEVRMADGTFISLWHNDSLSETGRWKGWRNVYANMVEYAVSS